MSLVSTEQILAALAVPDGSVGIGHWEDVRVEIGRQGDVLVVAHNLGGSAPRPTRVEALRLLDSLEACLRHLLREMPTLAPFEAADRWRIEVYVFSGPMDFPVVHRSAHGDTWFEALD